MNKPFITALLYSLSFSVSADMDQYRAEAREISGAFFSELKGELAKGLKAGGPVAAVGVCKELAPAIASKHAQRSGWDVGRTSLKLRNPNNAPDAWEAAVLLQLEQRRSSGEAVDSLTYDEIVEEGGDNYYRFMKGIVMPPMQEMPCLACHGETIDAETAAMLDRLYPQDEARGYKAGQLRGAFTLKKKL